jgi:predicted nucleic acid-binding protein
VIRIVLDVNVWVANFLAAARGRNGTCAQQLVESATSGQCRLGPLVSCISLAMLDTLEAVLEHECGFPRALAHAARNVAEAAGSPVAVVGGGVQPLADIEDQGVLETALAANAQLLVTGNMADFTRGARARIDAAILRKPELLLLTAPRLPNGMVITTPFAAKAWLIDAEPPPPGVPETWTPKHPPHPNLKT